jgi:hypothetical protein
MILGVGGGGGVDRRAGGGSISVAYDLSLSLDELCKTTTCVCMYVRVCVCVCCVLCYVVCCVLYIV